MREDSRAIAMNIVNSHTPPQPSGSALQLPAQRRISIPSSQRLATITETGQNAAAVPAIPRRSSRRNSRNSATGATSLRGSLVPSRFSRFSEDTTRTAPPPYDWVPEPLAGRDDRNEPVEGEKLARLRRGEGGARRGGWWRFILIGVVVLLVIIALAVGLGVGLSKKKHKPSSPQTPTNDLPPQKFPLGQYSMVTALKDMPTACTSNPDTWRCFPYFTFSPSDPSTNTSSRASFNWVINNTDTTYATNMTAATPPEGVPANLTVATSNNPFGITFSSKPLTYISSATNTSSPRLTFSFSMPKTVVPPTAISSDGSTAKCFFNETMFTGTIYLSAARNYPFGSEADSTSIGGFEQWPYAVEIMQTAAGGANVPDCYETTDGVVGQHITGLTPMPASAECMCDYRNY